jgi:acyl-CoA dehydrogenase
MSVTSLRRDYVTRPIVQWAEGVMPAEPCATRDRLVDGIYVCGKDEAVGALIDAFDQVIATQPIHDRLKKQHIRHWRDAQKRGLIDTKEIAALEAAEKAIAEVIAVDDFAPEELTHHDAPDRALSKTPQTAKVQIEAEALERACEPQPNIEPLPNTVLH